MRTTKNRNRKQKKRDAKRRKKERKVIRLPIGGEIKLPQVTELPRAAVAALSPKEMRKKARSTWENFKRLLKFKLLIPMQRNALSHPPEYIARGMAIGLGVAMTPLIGIQMYICIMIWLAARKFFKWHFSLLVSCAWTWTTNFFTMGPTYYLFYITGNKVLGRTSNGEYDGFSDKISAIFNEDMSTIEMGKAIAGVLIKDWGVAMMVGCIPYAILGAYLGYKIGYKYAKNRRDRLFKRYQPDA